MPAPTTRSEYLELVRKSGVVDDKRLDAYLAKPRAGGSLPDDLGKLAGVLVRDGVLTHFQAEQLLMGKWRRFYIGKYKVLERVGQGGMGTVYLCEHKFMRRRVAVKVLPSAKSEHGSARKRFYREAQAVAALDHPNIVRAYDIDQDDNLHFLVMEYIDGASLHEIVKRHGPLDMVRACHYIRQAAEGLEYAHRAAGLIHRDVKPGNILVDRTGVVKVLDMGLARLVHDDEAPITEEYDENVLGTADYLAPEQALDSHNVTIRADVYSLGATFYFCLTGQAPFGEGSVAQKLIWHQNRQPKSVREFRPDVPEALAAIIVKMMAKKEELRYQTPQEVVEALVPWTEQPIGPPPEKEMPRLSPAACGPGSFSESGLSTAPGSGATGVSPRPSPRAPRPTPSVPATPQPKFHSAAPAISAPESGSSREDLSAPIREPALQPAVAGRSADDTSSWESLTLASPQPGKARRRAETVSRKGSAGSPRMLPTRTQWAAVGAGVVLILAVLTAWGFFRNPRRDPPEHSQRQAVVHRELFVSSSGRNGAYKTIQAALDKAEPRDHVLVRDDRVEETLYLEEVGTRLEGVVVEPDPPGKPVLWVCPQDAKIRQFIYLNNVPGLCLKGFHLDAGSRLDYAVVLSRGCAGLRLENLHIEGAKKAAVGFWNCQGDERRPVVLKDVRLTAGKEIESALVWNALPNMLPPYNSDVEVTDCRFEGPFQAAVRFAGACRGLIFRHNRFFRNGEAFVYPKTNPPFQLQLHIDGNTFADTTQGVFQFLGLPPANSDHSVTIQNNLFFRTGPILQVDARERAGEVNSIITARDNVRDPAAKEGNVPSGSTQVNFTLPTNAADRQFLLYPQDDDLSRRGAGGNPVGALPPAD